MNAPVPSGPVCRSASIRILIIIPCPDDTTTKARTTCGEGRIPTLPARAAAVVLFVGLNVGAAYMRPMTGGEKRPGRIYASPTPPPQRDFFNRSLSGGLFQQPSLLRPGLAFYRDSLPDARHAFPRICRRRVFASTGYAGEAARRPSLPGRAEELPPAPFRLGQSIPPFSVGIDLPHRSKWLSPVGTKAHLPAFAVRAYSGECGMMVAPLNSFGAKGISKKFDKYR